MRPIIAVVLRRRRWRFVLLFFVVTAHQAGYLMLDVSDVCVLCNYVLGSKARWHVQGGIYGTTGHGRHHGRQAEGSAPSRRVRRVASRRVASSWLGTRMANKYLCPSPLLSTFALLFLGGIGSTFLDLP